MNKTKLIELLNKGLQMEYTDVFLYPREAQIIKEEEISETFEKYGRMEVRHADNLATQILALGGKPEWDFTILEAKESIDEMLLGHLEREKSGIEAYENLIELAEKEGEDQLKLILKGIKSEEEGHFLRMSELIERRKK